MYYFFGPFLLKLEIMSSKFQISGSHNVHFIYKIVSFLHELPSEQIFIRELEIAFSQIPTLVEELMEYLYFVYIAQIVNLKQAHHLPLLGTW